ncbi:Ig-like domain-containing protein [Planctomycetota bacterium]
MKRIKRSLKGRYWRKVITYFLTCCLFLNTSLPAVMAGPAGGVVDTGPNGGGAAEILYDQGTYLHTTQVNVETTRTIINWDSLDTAGGLADVRETLAFTQDLTGSAVLNRVSGPATQFNGDLSAPGMSIFIVNPAGVLFGSGSTVNVTQLVASGLDMQNGAFHAVLDDPVNNKMEFVGGDGNVTTRAYITADSVILIGKQVFNLGPIQAPDGLVVMAAGDEVRLYENGSDVAVVVSDIGDGFTDVRNSGYITADNGTIVLAAGDTFSRAVSNVGILAASGGAVKLQAASVENAGWIDVDASTSDGDGGSISLIGTEEVIVGTDALGNPSITTANANLTGNGGTITIQAGTETTEGMVTIEEASSITATGGSVSGGGGSVTITSDDFKIASDIIASPGNKIEEPGKLEINSSGATGVTIADGANAGALNTIYEEDIEALSQAGTSLIVNAEEGITVNNITDAIGNGEITGQFGNIELHATGENSAVTFADDTDTIRTSLGDIVIEAGSGGIDVGNLITGKDLTDEKPAPGQIFLTTENGGDIATRDLIIEDGWRHAEINVKSDGDLTVNGDVKVGNLSDILNVADQSAAEAMVYLKAGENVVINGEVCADAHGIEAAEDLTKAYIEILAGGDAEINGNVWAEASVSNNGTADAVIKIEAAGDVVFAEGVEVDAIADGAAAESNGPDYEDDEETIDGDHAQIIINDNAIVLVDDDVSTPKSVSIELNVLDNDTLKEGDAIDSYDIDPADGSLTEIKEDDLIVDLTYNPPEDLSTLTFDENGEATVSFTYTVNGRDATVTVTLTNGLPVAVADLAATHKGHTIKISVLTNDSDPDSGDVLAVIQGAITTKNGTLVLNEDGKSFTYTPNEGFVGDDSFTYAATDSYNTTSEVEVKITVSEEPPTSLSAISSSPFINPAPGLDSLELEVEITGCPALVKWAAEEVGIENKLVQIWVSNSLASTGNIQPCNSCEGLKNAAKILRDADGTHLAALGQVINEFASSTAPPTEEQMVAIADAIARNTDEDSYYAIADEYLEALATYIGVLSNEMGFSEVESVQLVTDKYIGRLAQDQNVGVATFIAASLAALGG